MGLCRDEKDSEPLSVSAREVGTRGENTSVSTSSWGASCLPTGCPEKLSNRPTDSRLVKGESGIKSQSYLTPKPPQSNKGCGFIFFHSQTGPTHEPAAEAVTKFSACGGQLGLPRHLEHPAFLLLPDILRTGPGQEQ